MRKSKKCSKQKPEKTIKIFLKKKKTKTGNQYRKLFKGNELSEAKKDEKTSICAKSL